MNLYKCPTVERLLMMALTPFFLLPLSCSNDDNSGDYYFSIKDEESDLIEWNTNYEEVEKSYGIDALGPWEVVDKDSVGWLEVSPQEGIDEDTVEIKLDENNTQETRKAEIAFFLNGQEQPMLFLVEQKNKTLKIDIDGEEYKVDGEGEDFSIPIKSDFDWSYELSDDSWLSEKELKNDEIKFESGINGGEKERTTTLTVMADEDPEIKEKIKISQPSAKVVLQEDFSWLDHGNVRLYKPSGGKKGRFRFENWSDEEKEHGWESTLIDGLDGQALLYARPGFVSVGKTNWGGDLISPKLSKLTEPTDVRVTFKSIPYKTAAGTEDDNDLYVSVIGGGDIDKEHFTIDNYPAYGGDYDDDPDNTELWQEYEFEIKGATSDTRIKWMGGKNYDLEDVGKGKNRIFFDDIKVEIINFNDD